MVNLDQKGVQLLDLPQGLTYKEVNYQPKENFRGDGSFRLDFPGAKNMACVRGYVKACDTTDPSEEFAGKLEGTHSSKNKNSGSYVLGIQLDGKRIRLRKEIHPKYTKSLAPKVTELGDLRGKLIGLQYFKYNEGKNVRCDVWIDLNPFDENGNPLNNWKHEYTVLDEGTFPASNKGKLSASQLKQIWLEPSIKNKGQYTIRVDDQKEDCFEYRYVSCVEIVPEGEGPIDHHCAQDEHWDEAQQKCIKNEPQPGGETDGDGVVIPHKRTGRTVKLNYGSRHRNGDRYNANHKFENYWSGAYFLIGKDQDVMEHKTDGPNHSGCTELKEPFRCQWAELDFAIQPHKGAKRGQGYISSEYPHPKNHDPVWEHVQTAQIDQDFRGKIIGFAVCAYWTPDGLRHYEEYVDPDGLINGKPANKWVKTVDCINDGQIMPNPKRQMPTMDRGLESEFRCNNGYKTEMYLGKIHEIVI